MMAKFLLLAYGSGRKPNLSAEEIQRITERYKTWSAKLGATGKLLGGNKLHDHEGRVVRQDKGKLVVTDGPYVESKEILGGYWLIEAKDYAEAETFLADNPHLGVGTLELRRIEEMGP
jgi:hypothetical protein